MTNNNKRPEAFGFRLAATARFKPQNSIFANPQITYPLLLFFAATDFANFWQLFSSKLEDSYVLISIMAVSFLCVYDLLPYLLGIQFAHRNAGYRINRRLMYIMLAFIAVGVVLNIVLRVGMKDELVPAMQETLSGEMTIRSDPMALPISLALAFVSIATSASAFYLSFCVSSPLSEDLKAVEGEKKRIESEILKLKMILSELECESPKEFAQRLSAEDLKRYKAMQFLAVEETLKANSEFRHLLMTFLGAPEDYNFISKSDNQSLLDKIREIAGDVGVDNIKDLDMLSDTNPGKAFDLIENRGC